MKVNATVIVGYDDETWKAFPIKDVEISTDSYGWRDLINGEVEDRFRKLWPEYCRKALFIHVQDIGETE